MVHIKSNNIYYLIYDPEVPLYGTAGVSTRPAVAVHQELTDLSGGTKH